LLDFVHDVTSVNDIVTKFTQRAKWLASCHC